MSDLSGKIWSAVRDAQNVPNFDTSEKRIAYEDAYASRATDRILALFREAMLSGTTIDAVSDALWDYSDREITAAKVAVEAALDAAGIKEQ